MQKPVEKPIKFVKNLSTKGKSFPITHVSAVIDDNGESVKSTLDSLKNKSSVTKVTWQELKDKRDAGKLTPGALYRITDYNCTTTQENTQSAGHQFDIVLLALSENKLAEDGWAMMHNNIYNVTFADGVTKKCWIYDNGNNPMAKYNIVDAVTLKGLVISIHTIEIDEEHKTAVVDQYYSDDLEDEDLTYNYFQNSNLSAWKVWYCLDNDKSRFAWADDSVDDKAIISFEVEGFGRVTLPRKESEDVVVNETQCYAWGYPDTNTAYTTSEQPVIGDKVFQLEEGLVEFSTIESVSEPTGLPNGRGVIYRLIDEFNNDVAYDFKNIQFIRPLTNGEYDDSTGTDTWVYTFNLWYNNACEDASVKIGNKQCATYNIITSLLSEDNDIFVLSNSVCLGFVNNRGKYCTSKNVRIHNSEECTLDYATDISIDASASIHIESGGIYCIMCSYSSYDAEGIYILNKKVLTEE